MKYGSTGKILYLLSSEIYISSLLVTLQFPELKEVLYFY